jgi:ribosomal protein S21
MSVIVHDDMPIDQALKMLWREANRENIPEELKEGRYYVPKSSQKHDRTKIWGKMKRRRRAAKRKADKKGQTYRSNS